LSPIDATFRERVLRFCHRSAEACSLRQVVITAAPSRAGVQTDIEKCGAVPKRLLFCVGSLCPAGARAAPRGEVDPATLR